MEQDPMEVSLTVFHHAGVDYGDRVESGHPALLSHLETWPASNVASPKVVSYGCGSR
jgi:hypothetical protein